MDDCLIVCDLETSQCGGLCPNWAVAPQKNDAFMDMGSYLVVMPILTCFCLSFVDMLITWPITCKVFRSVEHVSDCIIVKQISP
jgi:uncharacterized membrane protein